MGIIDVKNISKRYKGNTFYSLKEANFSIEEGDIVGLVGANGSGKSTLLKILAKAQKPTEGTVLFQGQDITASDNVLEDFGIMIEPSFIPDRSVEENLIFYLTLHRRQIEDQIMEKVLRLVGLWEVRHRKPKSFSFGMKQRTALAIALVTEPKILLLDEPFVGLDPIGVKELLAILKEWSHRQQTAMIISSHQLSELEEICTRYLLIDSGNVKEADIDLKPATIVTLPPSLSQEQTDVLTSLVSKYAVTHQDDRVIVEGGVSQEALNEILGQLTSNGLVKSISSQESALADLFTKG